MAGSSCACLSDLASYNLSGAVVNAGGATFPAFTPGAVYGPSYGIGCAAHDNGLAPFCDLDRESWCNSPWCWVNASECAPDFQPTPSSYFEGRLGLTYSYLSCNATNDFLSFYTTGHINLCSVFSLDSDATSEVVGETTSGDRLCGKTNTKAQVESMVSAINALYGGRGFVLPHAGEVLAPHMRLRYTWDMYPSGAWEAVGRNLSRSLFESSLCDVVVGMANGCRDAEIQAQAALAQAAGKMYFTGRGPQSVLRGAGNVGDGAPYIFSTHIRSDEYARPALEQLRLPPYLAKSVAIVAESFAYQGNQFFASLGEETVRLAGALGYQVVLNATVERPPGSPESGFDRARLNASLRAAVASRAHLLLLVMRQSEFMFSVEVLRQLRASDPPASSSALPADVDPADGAVDVEDAWRAGRAHTWKAVWWQGTSWGTRGNCLDLGTSVCAHVLGAEQMSRSEALDAYGDALLEGRTYRWFKASRHLTEPITSYTDKPDAAMIPSLLAQALQMTFRHRPLSNASRPLADRDNYNALLSTLRSGLIIARTFYGAVRFDAFGQNSGKEPTTMQMDGGNTTGTTAFAAQGLGRCLARESQACGLGACTQVAPLTDASSTANASLALSPTGLGESPDDDNGIPRARIVLPSTLLETGLLYPAPASMSCPKQAIGTVGDACLLCETFVCEAHSPPPSPPALPPPSLPPLPPPPDWTVIILITSLGAFVLCALVVAAAFRRHHRRQRLQAAKAAAVAQEAAVAAAKQETEDLASIMDAIDTTFDLPYPAALMPAADFLALDQLVEHERLRDGGLLRYRDTMDGLRDANGTQSLYIFMSHQWTAWSAPDPSGTQLRVMKAAVRHVAAVHGWSLDAVMVWVDYCSIPQSNAACMQQAISSLSAYSACAAAFVIVAPEVEHSDTKALCGVDTYRKRMWCRAEQLFHSLINGTGSMWLATAEASVTPLSDLPSWSTYSGYLNVFDGDATDETDKLMLMLPVLGLYATLFAAVMHEREERRDGGGEGDVSLSKLEKILDAIAADKEGVFPSEVVLRDTEASRAMRARKAATRGVARLSTSDKIFAAGLAPPLVPPSESGGGPIWAGQRASIQERPRRKQRRTSINSGRVQLGSGEETHTLFGGLIARLEGIIHDDEGLREGLAEQRRKLTDARQHTEVSMRTSKVVASPSLPPDGEREAAAVKTQEVVKQVQASPNLHKPEHAPPPSSRSRARGNEKLGEISVFV